MGRERHYWSRIIRHILFWTLFYFITFFKLSQTKIIKRLLAAYGSNYNGCRDGQKETPGTGAQ